MKKQTALNLSQLIRRAKKYVEMEASTRVTRVSFAERFFLLGREDIALSVTTTDPDYPEWWVVGGSTPMNLYSKSKFETADEAFSFHSGLMLRLSADYAESQEAPEGIGYDAFVSHASEDKEVFVRPLAQALAARGFRVWYDEFVLKVGDSLRRSIDKGLVNSRYGVVVLSPAFFRKNWPQYELDALATREIDGTKVILPVWHGVGKEDVTRYSPSLADKVAANTATMSLHEVADALAEVLAEPTGERGE